MNAQHTPTPWQAVAGDTDGRFTQWSIRTSDGAEIANLYYVNETGAANAAFIVRACNAHADLVAALVGLRAAFRCCIGQTAFNEFEASNPAVIAAAAALAKAGKA